MRYYILFALITLGTYAAVGISTALAVSLSARRLRRHIATRSAVERARTLAAVRLLPVAAGAFTTLLTGSLFLRYEPRDTVESPGLLLLAFALSTVALSVAAARRLLTSLRASSACSRLVRQCGRRWSRDDGQRIWIIESAYPVAAVTGLFRTRLLISTRILSECPPRERSRARAPARQFGARRDAISAGSPVAARGRPPVASRMGGRGRGSGR